MLTVSITRLHLNKKIKANWLRQVVKETLKYEGVSDGEISIVLGDDELLKKLNKEYRGKNKPTDVLAFSWDQTFNIQGLTPIMGEVIISIDAVMRQAEEYKHSFEKELAILLIHGVLHILGYDHSNDNLPQEPMGRRTAAILEKVMK
jgi:probable rRNA maturation factor